jgi:hypothetical protein
MQNSLGNITEAMDLEVYYGPNKKKETFFIINLGGDEMLLGYPFLSPTMLSPQRGFVHTLRFRIRSVPEHVFRLLRCALIGIAQSLSFEGKSPPLRTFEV